MHEMSIITSILQIARDHAHEAGAEVIEKIEVEVGTLAGIEIPSLEFCFQAARTQIVGEQAELVIRRVEGRGRCPACGQESAMDFYSAVCPACGDGVLEILQGRELRVLSIQVE